MPVVLQTNLADCGAACLTTVLRHHGHATTLREVRERVGVARDGLTARDLVDAGRAYGLVGRAFSVAPAALANVPGAVVHWEFNHFLVLERWTPHGVDLVDPAHGRRRLTAAEFDAGFTGVAIVFTPGPEFRRRRPARGPQPWRRRLLRSIVAEHRGLWLQAVGGSVALQLMGVMVPVLTELAVDHGLTGSSTLLGVLGVGLLLTVLCHLCLSTIRTHVLTALRVRADATLTAGVVTHLLGLPYTFFAQRGAADLATRTGSVSVIREAVAGSLLPAVLDGPMTLGFLALVGVRDPVLGGFLTAVVALQLGVLLGSRRRVSALAQQELQTLSTAQGFLIECIEGIETIKAAGAEAQAGEQWRRRFTSQLNATVHARRAMGLVEAALSSLQLLAPLGLLWLGAWRVAGGSLSLGAMLGLVAIGTLALAPLTSLAEGLQLLQMASAHLDRLVDIAESAPEGGGEIGTAPIELRGAVDVRDLGFRYDPRAPWTLRHVSFTARPGEKIALVGRSGCGKTTLARILLALHPPTEGEVRYDGAPAGDLDPRQLRREFGVVSQDPALFTGTIRENVCLADPAAPMDRLVEAARRAGIHDDIVRLPMGYETMLSEGDGLSGGQRQRLALARALLTRPRILVLDEATSHLDAATEAAIEAQLSRLPQTRIVIAHRLSTVVDADLILVLDQGRVVERGTYDQLVRAGGHFSALIAPQTAARAPQAVG